MTSETAPAARGNESGFTLVEALVAMLVLAVGLVAISNLMIVSAASNSLGNHLTAATNVAAETMERLRAIPFGSITASTNADVLTVDRGSTTNCQDPATPTGGGCVVPGNFNMARTVDGVGTIKTRWQITQVDGQLYFITVRSESLSPLMRSRSRVEFTLFRACTASGLGCPTP
jgi:prepilin-type N-terminal cleavage/methylation domain-containing protein